MKRLYIVVEGQTEREFVNSVVLPYLSLFGITHITPVLIRTSISGRGGFSKYSHLRKDIMKLLSSKSNEVVVSMFVDFFRMPDVPFRERWEMKSTHLEQVIEMERCIYDDINDYRFVPYIQLHEFEALLFSSNRGFDTYFTKNESKETEKIIITYQNPEDINTNPDGAPSKRIKFINSNYEKIIDGNLIALEIGINEMLAKCPHFNNWIEILKEKAK